MDEDKTRIVLNDRGCGSRMSRFRLTSSAPFLVSAIAFVLSILLLVAGTMPSMMQDYDMLALNTSQLGQNIIQFSATTTTAAKAKRVANLDNPLDPLGILPTAIASASGSSSTGSSSVSDALTALGGFFSGIVNNITSSIDGSLNDAEAQAVAAVVQALGVEEYYALHILNICSGNLSSATHSDASFDATECVSYSSPGSGLSNFTSNIPSSFTVATTNVSAPFLAELGTSGDYLGNILTSLSKTLIAFYILGIIGSGVTMLGSLIAILYGNSRILLYINMSFSTLGIVFLFAGSTAATVLVTIVARIINMIGNGIGLYAISGNKFLTLTWVAFAMMLLANAFWNLVWLVEFKTFRLVLERRPPEQRGTYLGVFREVKENLSLEPRIDAPPVAATRDEQLIGSSRGV